MSDIPNMIGALVDDTEGGEPEPEEQIQIDSKTRR